MFGRSKLHKKLNILPHSILMLVSAAFRRIYNNPVFIVGCGHSGTTLLLRIMGAHPGFYPIMTESNTFVKRRYHNLRTYDMLAFFTNKRRWVEKTPKHVRYLADIFSLRPTAKVIFITRDGRDVALSIRKRKGDIIEGIERWVMDNDAGFACIDDPRLVMVRYEDLVASFKDEMTRIFEFLGERYDERIEEFHAAYDAGHAIHEKPESQFGTGHRNYRMWQVSQPLFDGRGKWRQEMTDDERLLFKRLAGDALVRFGYAKDLEW